MTRGIDKISGLRPPYVQDNVRHVFYQYVVRVEDDYPVRRDELAERLKGRGVDVAVHYSTPIYRQPFYKGLGYGQTVCPMAEEAC